MKVPLQFFWLILCCWTTQIRVRQAEALTELSEKALRHWYELFRKHLPLDYAVLEKLVQLDEAYFGGRKGYALLMGKQIGTRKLAYHILPQASAGKEDAIVFLETFVKPHATLNTDGAVMYKNIHQWWPVEHHYDIHKRFEFTQTSEIEGMFGASRTFIRRMYHHTTPEKFPDIMCEFYYRFFHPELFKNPHYYLQNTLTIVPTG